MNHKVQLSRRTPVRGCSGIANDICYGSGAKHFLVNLMYLKVSLGRQVLRTELRQSVSGQLEYQSS